MAHFIIDLRETLILSENLNFKTAYVVNKLSLIFLLHNIIFFKDVGVCL